MLAPEVVERLKDAAVAIGTESVSSLLEKGALVYVEGLERERGEGFPHRGEALRVGRPKKAQDK